MNTPSKCAVCKKEVDRYNGRMIFDVWHCDECALVARAAPRPTPNARGKGNGHFEQMAAAPPSEVVQAPAEAVQVGVVTGRQSTRRIPALPPSPTVLTDYEAIDTLSKASLSMKGLRSNEGKPRHSLISASAMEGLARVLTYGAQKYTRYGDCTCHRANELHAEDCAAKRLQSSGADNWRKGLSWRETIDSLKRHLAAFERGEELDDESGLPHIDHALCNLMFLSEFQKLGRGTDDRWKP